MKIHPLHLAVVLVPMSIAAISRADEAEKGTPPVEFPKLETFEPLWKRSIFTTKDLPAPEDPGAPNFADNLSLSGVYEIDGGVVAVLVDRTTSQVMEARIGSENEMGIKIRQVTPGATVDKTRIQLQKGDKAGWVGFGDPESVQPAEVVQRAVIPTQAPATARSAPPSGAAPPPNPILPPPAAPGSNAAPVVNDVPLPPP
ncbi:MAG: hypothetical protein R3F13_19905 [Prosthecobacter sp.]